MRRSRHCTPGWPAAGKAAKAAITAFLLLAALQVNAQLPIDALQQQVLAAERAFARTMADRDAQAFARFVADEAIFFDGATPLRGRPQVVAGWARFFTGKTAPFSWEPDQVEVLDSATLALSTGLVRDPGGKVIARFNSIWRLEAPGVWRVVFDKGSPPTAAERQ
jgi:ketosteroid isomerase-like protein